MRTAVWGLILVAGLGLTLWVMAEWDVASAQGPSPLPQMRSASTDSLIALGFEQPQGPQTVLIVDPRTRVMSAYHIDRATGEIALKSVRNVQWDLRMEEFNGVSPTPREIRQLMQRR